MGPVKLRFAGVADITERDDAAKRLVVDGRAPTRRVAARPASTLVAQLSPTSTGTKVEVVQDLQLSGAAAQYGRGMIADVTAILMRDFATNMQRRIEAKQRGDDPDQVENVVTVGGFGLGVRALQLALMRVFRRFFLPYQRPEEAL